MLCNKIKEVLYTWRKKNQEHDNSGYTVSTLFRVYFKHVFVSM